MFDPFRARDRLTQVLQPSRVLAVRETMACIGIRSEVGAS
jgi:hypothetical protein